MRVPTSEITEKLKLERSILADGGYGCSVRAPRQELEYFRDSITCLNQGEFEKLHPCTECFLTEFVSPSHNNEMFPCHFIPLNSQGDTIDSLLQAGDKQRLEEQLLQWLDQTIGRLESQENREE
jgi:hypothetical protein